MILTFFRRRSHAERESAIQNEINDRTENRLVWELLGASGAGVHSACGTSRMTQPSVADACILTSHILEFQRYPRPPVRCRGLFNRI